MTDRPKTTLRDCIFGLAVGDALGVPYEFRPRGTFECTDMTGYGTHGQPAGTWSDDTSMTLATCDSIRELGHINTADMRDKFVSWIARGEYTIDGVFDYGGTTARALHTGKGGSGSPPCTPASRSPSSTRLGPGCPRVPRISSRSPWLPPIFPRHASARSRVRFRLRDD